jgi:hypothetical protein
MTTTERAILRTLLYFDIFGHPLEKTELYNLIGTNPGRDDFEVEFEALLKQQLIGMKSGYVYLVNGTSSIDERIKKLKRSIKYRRIARFMASLIYWHPFVRGVLISGSLSKNAPSKKDDIDFFVIAQPGRIWICKTFLMLFKKLFLLNSKKYFCINYVIDTETLEIPEKNIFTATELAFLIPLKNPPLCEKFLNSNTWVQSFFPNLTFNLNGCRHSADPLPKKILEKTFNGKAGDTLDSHFMEIYKHRSQRKFGKKVNGYFDLNFKNDKNVSKYHPHGFQQIIIERYKRRISEFETEKQMDLTI